MDNYKMIIEKKIKQTFHKSFQQRDPKKFTLTTITCDEGKLY